MADKEITVGQLCELFRDRELLVIHRRCPQGPHGTTIEISIAYEGEAWKVKENKDGEFNYIRKEIVRQIETEEYSAPVHIHCGSPL